MNAHNSRMPRGTYGLPARVSAWAAGLAATSCMWMGCAGTVHEPTVGVIVAGSVCSGEPHLVAAPGPASASPAVRAQLLAYVTDGHPSELVVYDVDHGQEKFRVQVNLRNRPQLLEDVVVAVDDTAQLVGYDLETGAVRFRHEVERASWLGAVQVGPYVISSSTSLSYKPAERGSTVTAIDLRSGSQRWQRSVPYALSRPVAWGERVLVASDHADLWALYASDGNTSGCASFGREPIDWLAVLQGNLWLGGADAQQVTLGSAPDSAPAAGARLHLPFDDLPGRPMVRPSSYDSVPASHSAHGRVGVEAPLSADASGAHLAGSHFLYKFYRQLFAYTPEGQLAWAHLFDSDVVSVRVIGDAALVVTEAGALFWLQTSDGAQLAHQQLSTRVSSADARLDHQPSFPQPASARELTLRQELSAIALDTDARLLPGRRLAASALAASSDPQATRDLLTVFEQTNAPRELKTHIASVLATRTSGSDILLAALGAHYDFLTSQPAPPLAAIVPGLVHAHEVRAVPKLIERLFDPDTTLKELHLVVDALATLGTQEALPALAKFYAMYHADSAFRDDALSLVDAAKALWHSNVANDVKLVQASAQDPATLPEISSVLLSLMAAVEVKPQAQAAEATAMTAPQPALPTRQRLGDADISRTFAEHAQELRDCVDAAKDPSLRTLRFSFVIESDGSLTRAHIWPERAALQQCLVPKLTNTRFPAVSTGRRMANYTFVVQPDKPEGELPTKPPETVPFWRKAQQRSLTQTNASKQAPWWQNQNPLYVSVDVPQAQSPQTSAKSPAPQPQKVEPAPADTWWQPTQQ